MSENHVYIPQIIPNNNAQPHFGTALCLCLVSPRDDDYLAMPSLIILSLSLFLFILFFRAFKVNGKRFFGSNGILYSLAFSFHHRCQNIFYAPSKRDSTNVFLFKTKDRKFVVFFACYNVWKAETQQWIRH